MNIMAKIPLFCLSKAEKKRILIQKDLRYELDKFYERIYVVERYSGRLTKITSGTIKDVAFYADGSTEAKIMNKDGIRISWEFIESVPVKAH